MRKFCQFGERWGIYEIFLGPDSLRCLLHFVLSSSWCFYAPVSHSDVVTMGGKSWLRCGFGVLIVQHSSLMLESGQIVIFRKYLKKLSDQFSNIDRDGYLFPFFFLIWYLKYCLARQNFRVNLSFLTHLYFSYNCNYFSSIAFHAWCYICLKLDAGNLRYFVSIQFLLIILFLCLQKKSVCFELFFAKW